VQRLQCAAGRQAASTALEFRQFSLRGLHRVQAEWKLACLALNLRRMAAMQPAQSG